MTIHNMKIMYQYFSGLIYFVVISNKKKYTQKYYLISGIFKGSIETFACSWVVFHESAIS